MSNWVDTYLIRNFSVFSVSLGEKFNVENLSNGYKYTDIKFIYAYEYIKTNSYLWDSTLTLKGEYPIYWFSAPDEGTVIYDSKINVLVFEEGRSEGGVDDSIKSGEWRDMTVIGTMLVAKLDKSNNFEINLDAIDFGVWKNGKYKIIPMVNKFLFSEFDRGYDISVINLNSNRYKCSVSNWRFKGKYQDIEIKNPGRYTHKLKDDCVFSIVSQYATTLDKDKRCSVSCSVDGELRYNTSNFLLAHNQTTIYKDYSKEKIVTFDSSGDIKAYGLRIREYLAEYSQVDDAEITLLFIQEVC